MKKDNDNTVKIATADEIRNIFLVKGDKLETSRQIFNFISNSFSRDELADLFIAVMKTLELTVKAEGGDLSDWTSIRRALWGTKQAFCLGFCHGWAVTMEAQEQGFVELFGVDALGCEPGGFGLD